MNPEEILTAKRAQLARLHPLKSEHYQRARELYDQRNGIKEAATLRTEERTITQGNPLDLFPTPADLARRMVNIAAQRAPSVCQWLEPSAGTGRIADEIKRAGFGVHCVELNYNAAQLLQKRGYTVTCGDFLEYQDRADVIVMNPPFSNCADVDHVLHAFDLLNPGGCIVSIMGEHAFIASDKKSTAFREWLTRHGTSEPLPPASFKASGTMVNCRLVIIDKA